MPCDGPSAGVASRLGVADIFRLHGASFRASRHLSCAQQKVMRVVETCRTAALGGHKELCAHCGEVRCTYNSCRNRHCPKCQTLVKARWLEDRNAELLPVPYFHVHCVIPGGALAPDGERWIASDTTFLFPVRALSVVFRAKFVDALKQASADGLLSFPPSDEGVSSPEELASLVQRLRTIDWVVYAKRSFAGPEKVLDYLGRYTHRVAISNHRIVDVHDDHVTFTYRDRRHGNELRTATLDAHTFIGRFLLHVLPDGFMRIRYYGFLASRCKAKDLRRCRQLFGLPAEPPARPKLTVAQWLKNVLDVDLDRCPACGRGPLLRTRLPPQLATPSGPAMDTS